MVKSLLRAVLSVRRPGARLPVNGHIARLPLEVYRVVVRFLRVTDLRAFVLMCKSAHDACGALIYGTLAVHEGNAQKCLLAFLYRLQPEAATHVRYPPVLFLRILKFKSIDHEDDPRLLILLCDVLVHARQLLYLDIRVPDDSIALFILLLERFGVARVSTSTAAASFKTLSFLHTSSDSQPFTLPVLRCIRSTSYEVVAALCRHRRLQNIVLDGVMRRADLARFLEDIATSPAAAELTAFSCNAAVADMSAFISAVGDVFPSLTYLNIIVETRPPAGQRTTVAVARGTLDVLGGCPPLLPRIQVLSVESRWCVCSSLQPNIGNLMRWARPVAHSRPELRRILFSCAALTRHDEQGTWVVSSVRKAERILLATGGLARSLLAMR